VGGALETRGFSPRDGVAKLNPRVCSKKIAAKIERRKERLVIVVVHFDMDFACVKREARVSAFRGEICSISVKQFRLGGLSFFRVFSVPVFVAMALCRAWVEAVHPRQDSHASADSDIVRQLICTQVTLSHRFWQRKHRA
jgi:hypothetical protein